MIDQSATYNMREDPRDEDYIIDEQDEHYNMRDELCSLKIKHHNIYCGQGL
jgi:hypothetical protein